MGHTATLVEARAESSSRLSRALDVRRFDLVRMLPGFGIDDVLDPVTQRKVPPLTFAFLPSVGASAMTLFVDHGGELGRMLATLEPGKEKSITLSELEARLRDHGGLFCLVTTPFSAQPLPMEFHLHFALEYPSEEVQIRCWDEHLGSGAGREEDLVRLVERWPMHVEEIDRVARQAAILSVIRGGTTRPGLAEVEEVIARCRRVNKSRVLFGG